MNSSAFLAIFGVVLTTTFLLGGEILPLDSGEKAPVYPITLSEKDDIPKLLRELKTRWPEQLIDPRSEDYAVLYFICAREELVKKAIPELLQLVGLLEPQTQYGTERNSKLRLSLAGRGLAGIGDEAEPIIKKWLATASISPDEQEVLELALKSISARREYKLRKEAQKKQRASAIPKHSELPQDIPKAAVPAGGAILMPEKTIRQSSN